ncbi:17729_t:CDS:1, partial [Gigaspora margarita]
LDNFSNNYYSMDDNSDTNFEDSVEIENQNNALELKVGLLLKVLLI